MLLSHADVVSWQENPFSSSSFCSWWHC